MKTALICTVGDSYDPIVKHIINLKPDLVYFLFTEKTGKNIELIVNQTDIKCFDKEILNFPNNIDETFSKSLNIISNLLRKNYKVIGNFTAGTKPMSAGLAMACVERRCGYEYGDGERDEKTGMSISFKENIIQDNPYEKYAINEFKRGRWFFNKYQFLASLENFKHASEILDGGNLKTRSDMLVKIVSFYESWDKFNDKNLKNDLKEILNQINDTNELYEYLTLEFPDFYNQMNRNLEFLDKKDNPMCYLPDLLNNAKRRICEGKYDDAVARLYRTLELVAQLQLFKYHIVDEKTFREEKRFQIDVDKLKKKKSYEKISAKFNTRYDYLDRLDLTKDYLLLELLSEDSSYDLDKSSQYLVKSFKNIRSRVELRNKSILAHGLKPLNERDALDIYKIIKKHSKKVCSNLEKEMEISKFPLFKEE